jgi:DNA-binding NtrC family response regulator
MRVLILEDTKSDLELLQRELKRSGISCACEVAVNEKTFREMLQTFVPDLILSDYALPSFTGAAAFRIAKGMCPDVPFIIVSGTIGEETAVQLIKDGVTDFILKDNLFQLGFKIERAMKEAKERTEKKTAYEIMRRQHKELREIAFLHAHEIRRPIASIKGLLGLFDFSNPQAEINGEIIPKLLVAVDEFDAIVKNIIHKADAVT